MQYIKKDVHDILNHLHNIENRTSQYLELSHNIENNLLNIGNDLLNIEKKTLTRNHHLVQSCQGTVGH